MVKCIIDKEWKDNKIHGLGVYLWSEGKKYIGSWKNAKMHGVGMFTWPDERTYLGEYEDDKRNNFGIYNDGNKKYQGFWKNGNKNYLGKQVKKDGSFKLGIWENNTLKKEIVDENENASKLAEIDNYIEETKKKVAVVIKALKLLLENTRPDFLEDLQQLLIT